MWSTWSRENDRNQSAPSYRYERAGGKSVSHHATCDRIVVLRVVSPQEPEIVVDRLGAPVWDAAWAVQKNGQSPISLGKLRAIRESF